MMIYYVQAGVEGLGQEGVQNIAGNIDVDGKALKQLLGGRDFRVASIGVRVKHSF